jgi:hypothetical protein
MGEDELLVIKTVKIGIPGWSGERNNRSHIKCFRA